MYFNAIYSDGTKYQWDDSIPDTQAYSKIDRSKLIALEVKDKEDSIPRHICCIEKGQRLILRRRTMMSLSGKVKGFFYLVGYQETVGSENRQAITILYPDGSTILISKWKESPFHEVILRAEEK